jgi:hypothetical protein
MQTNTTPYSLCIEAHKDKDKDKERSGKIDVANSHDSLSKPRERAGNRILDCILASFLPPSQEDEERTDST